MQQDRPFRGLASFGNNFLSKFEGAEVNWTSFKNFWCYFDILRIIFILFTAPLGYCEYFAEHHYRWHSRSAGGGKTENRQRLRLRRYVCLSLVCSSVCMCISACVDLLILMWMRLVDPLILSVTLRYRGHQVVCREGRYDHRHVWRTQAGHLWRAENRVRCLKAPPRQD